MGKNIDQITRAVTVVTGTERMVLRDGTVGVDDQDAKITVANLIDARVSALIATARRGTIQLWGAAAAPTGALLCQGQAVSRTTYAALFAIIGTTFGVGDNSTTFNVPNFQGVVPKGVGSQTINTRSKSGPVLGALQEDQFQGFKMQIQQWTGMYGATSFAATLSFTEGQGGISRGQIYGDSIITDGVNGTPRTGATTQENCLGINFIIWY